MNTETSKTITHKFSKLDRLDPVTVYLEDFSKGAGQITIVCYGKAWTAYWGGMGEKTVSEFFCSCDKEYLIGNLSPQLDSEINDIDKIQEDARNKGVECWRDDPWNDYEFMTDMYGDDMCEWHYLLPKTANHEYDYLCRIIKVVQDELNAINKGEPCKN